MSCPDSSLSRSLSRTDPHRFRVRPVSEVFLCGSGRCLDIHIHEFSCRDSFASALCLLWLLICSSSCVGVDMPLPLWSLIVRVHFFSLCDTCHIFCKLLLRIFLLGKEVGVFCIGVLLRLLCRRRVLGMVRAFGKFSCWVFIWDFPPHEFLPCELFPNKQELGVRGKDLRYIRFAQMRFLAFRLPTFSFVQTAVYAIWLI